MNNPRSRPALFALLAATVLVLAWVVLRVGSTSPDAAQPAMRPTRTGPVATSSAATDPASGLLWVAESALPEQAEVTLAHIRAGGPYPYPRNDNKTFRNSERLLPRQGNGYYREYTVKTPGSNDRGARRIITGSPDEKYWTDDHYDSFSRIREGT